MKEKTNADLCRDAMSKTSTYYHHDDLTAFIKLLDNKDAEIARLRDALEAYGELKDMTALKITTKISDLQTKLSKAMGALEKIANPNRFPGSYWSSVCKKDEDIATTALNEVGEGK